MFSRDAAFRGRRETERSALEKRSASPRG